MLYALRAQHNGHGRVRRPTSSGSHFFLWRCGQSDAASRCVPFILIAYESARAPRLAEKHVCPPQNTAHHGDFRCHLAIWKADNDRLLIFARYISLFAAPFAPAPQVQLRAGASAHPPAEAGVVRVF